MKVVGVLLLVLLATVSAKEFGSVLFALPSLQAGDGGFSSPSGAHTLESTADALFLASLYGLNSRINTAAIPGFIQSLENADFGYAPAAGEPSDLSSTVHAVLAYKHLGQPIPNELNFLTYINSLVQSPLVRPAAGQGASIKATATALLGWELLGDTQQIASLSGPLKAFLQKHIKNDHFEFDEPSLSQTEANYYGIVAARHVGLKLDTERFAKFIVALQDSHGSFKDASDSTKTSIESASYAVSSLDELEKIADANNKYTSLVDAKELREALQTVPFTLRHAANAHRAMAIVDFAGSIRTDLRYQVAAGAPPAKGKHISQGSRLKPTILFFAFGAAHTELAVEAIYAMKERKSIRLHPYEGRYEPTEPIDLGKWLGGLKFSFHATLEVAGLGEVTIDIEDEVRVGYNMVVQASAAHEQTGRTIEAGEAVSVGTEFDFGITLRNQDRAAFVIGTFDVLFSVLDSSDVAIETQTLDARKNKAPIHFEYSLQQSNIPSGELRFVFEIRDASGVIHTSESVSYVLNVPMIATDISFATKGDDVKFKLGDKASVSMKPASFLDLSSVENFDAALSGDRAFFLDASTPSGTLLRSIAGVPASKSGDAVYKFEWNVESALDSIGNTIVSFRYRTASGHDIQLSNYDSTLGELFDDTTTLNYTVNAQLAMVDVQKSSATDLVYGDEVKITFKIKDLVSGKFVRQGENANAFLNLNHQDERRERAFRSAQQAADQDGDKFVIVWQVEPNAVQGAGYISLTVENTDGESSPLFDSTGKKEVRYDVTVGGDIDVQYTGRSVADQFASATAFVAEFELSCKGKQLRGARLSADVRYGGELVAQLPVANSQAGTYTVAWTAPHRSAPSGTYQISVFREVDRTRANEEDSFKARELRRERQEKELRGESVPEQEEQITPTQLTPLFEASLSHSAASRGLLPVRTEFLAIGGFGVLLYLAFGIRRDFLANK